MGELADMLAHKGGGGAPPEEDDGGDGKAMAVASVKAFFEAGKAGDFETAAEHLSAAMAHCESMEPGEDSGGGGHALLLVPHGK